MPVRKIPRYGAGHKNLGKFASVKTGRVAWYESPLEKDSCICWTITTT